MLVGEPDSLKRKSNLSPSGGSFSIKLPKGFDSHLKQLETLLMVKIMARGEEIRVEGEPESVKKARRMLHTLQTAVQIGIAPQTGSVKFYV
ncbi:MAG: hypothetical protein ACYDBV_09550 [Nitrospiria bacterium]